MRVYGSALRPREWRRGALALVMLLAGATTALVTHPAAQAKEVTDCSDNHTNCFSLAYTDAQGQQHALTDSSGHPVPVDQSGQVFSGETITVEGWNWKLNQRYEVWLSEPFTDVSQEPNVNECYIRVDSERAPQATSLPDHPNAPGSFSVNFTVPEIPRTPQFANGAKFVVEVGGPGIGCIGGNGAKDDPSDLEDQAQEIIFTAFPTPPCVPALHTPCLNVSPGVVYPGGSVNVSGAGWNPQASTVALYLSNGTGAPSCGVLEQTVALDPADTTGKFATTIIAPPLPTLPANLSGNGVLPTGFQVYAVSPAPANGACATTSSDTKAAPLYVSQPTLTVTSGVHSDDTVTIAGAHWLGGDLTTHTASPVTLAIYVGNDKNFTCSATKAFTTTSQLGEAPNDGLFSVNYQAERVSSDTVKQVRVVALPAGASLSNPCDAATASACAQPQTSAVNCPLMVAATTFKILPIVVAAPNWLFILIPLALLLLLLPLFFWLGRREETEVVVTEQDITVERDVADVTGSRKFADSTYARTIRITREVVQIRTGKVIDQEVEEYDVFRDAQGREVRRLRPVTVTATVVTPAPTTNV